MTMIKKASTNVVRYFMMRLSATNKAATGLTITTFDLQYTRELTAAATKIDAIVGTGGAATHVDNKVFEVNATSSPGLYMVCFPDAAFATGVDQVTLNLSYGATVFTEAQNIQLVAFDPFDAVRMGMTALPNAAADAAGGVPISDAGGLDLDAKLANTNEVTAARMATLTDWINGGRLDLLLDAIPTTAMRGTDGVDTASMRGTDGALTDKAGFSLSTAGILAVWHQALTAIVTAGSIGLLLKDEITSARMAVLTDWINGGRLDLLLDAIPTTAMRGTDGVDTATMRGTDSANTTTPPTVVAIRQEMDSNSTQLAAIKGDTVIPAKNAIFNDIPVLMVDSTDHVTPKTGLTVAVNRSLDGAAFGSATGSIAEVGNGLYSFDASAADMNADKVTFRFSAATADDTFLTLITR